jgi:hypothetical protein
MSFPRLILSLTERGPVVTTVIYTVALFATIMTLWLLGTEARKNSPARNAVPSMNVPTKTFHHASEESRNARTAELPFTLGTARETMRIGSSFVTVV